MNNLSQVRVLVTGGTGFIGSRLVPRLQRAGAEVSVSTRDAARARKLLGPDVSVSESLVDLARLQPRCVINLAGAGIADRPWTSGRRETLLASRVAFTEALHQALASAPPEVVVNASAVGYYGSSEDRTFTEEDGPGEGFAAQLCQRWEAAAMAFESTGSRLVRLRLGLVLGPGGLLGRMKLPFSLGLGGRIGHGRQWMSWVHMEDVLGLLERSLTDPGLSGPVNATAPAPVTNADFTAALGRVLRRPTPFPIPALVLRTLLGDMADELLLSGARVLPARAHEADYLFRFETIEEALADALASEAD